MDVIDAPIRALAAAVVIRAVHDLRLRGDAARAVDALSWFCSDADLWLEALDVDVDPWTFVTSGRARQVRKGLVAYARRECSGHVRRP